MKKIIILFLVCFPGFCIGQKVQNEKTKEIFDLKEKVSTYCSVVLQPKGMQINFYVGIDELGFNSFVDDAGKTIEFKTIIAIMNYMDKFGWEYVSAIGGTDGAAPQYFFRKKK